jgi:hypothetical protein
MTDADPRKRLNAAYNEAGSYRALGIKLGLSPAFLCDVRNGRRGFSDTLLARLGLKKRETYVAIGDDR